MPAPRLVHSDSWLDNVGASFERILLRQDLSPKTVRSYGIGVKNFFVFLREQGVDDMHYVTRELIEDWQDAMRERVNPPLRAGSRSLYTTAVRQLLRFAADRDIVDPRLERAIVPVKVRSRHSETERQPIPEEDLACLMAYLGPRRPRMRLIDFRDRALFFFLLQTACRVNEALQVPRNRFQHARVRQKGGSYIEFELTPTTIEFVEDYLRARTDELPQLWIAIGNNVGQLRPLADSGVREIWRKLCVKLGIPRFTTHQLRHTAATILLDGGIDHVAIASHLHHADTRTVHRYAKVGDRVRQKTLDVMEDFIHGGAKVLPQMLQRKSPPGGRPRYR